MDIEVSPSRDYTGLRLRIIEYMRLGVVICAFIEIPSALMLLLGGTYCSVFQNTTLERCLLPGESSEYGLVRHLTIAYNAFYMVFCVMLFFILVAKAKITPNDTASINPFSRLWSVFWKRQPYMTKQRFQENLLHEISLWFTSVAMYIGVVWEFAYIESYPDLLVTEIGSVAFNTLAICYTRQTDIDESTLSNLFSTRTRDQQENGTRNRPYDIVLGALVRFCLYIIIVHNLVYLVYDFETLSQRNNDVSRTGYEKNLNSLFSGFIVYYRFMSLQITFSMI